MQPRAILFDFDGTLVQTRDSSWKLFCETNKEFGLGIETQQDFFALLEDNMFAALKRHCKDDARGEQAARHFLELLRTAYFPDLVPGMSDVVRSLAGTYSLAVLSSNSMSAIRRILIDKQIAHCFSHVFTGDVEPDKRATVRRFLTDESYATSRACSPAYIEDSKPSLPTADEVVLVTDTVGDVKHAKECGIRAIGVSWGMHSEEKLLAAGAEIVALWPQEIVAYLLPGGFAAAVCACTPGAQNGSASIVAADCSCSVDPLQTAATIRRQRATSAAINLRAADGGGAASNGTFRSEPQATAAEAGLRKAIGRISASRTKSPGEPTSRASSIPAGAGPDPAILRALTRLRGNAGQHRDAAPNP